MRPPSSRRALGFSLPEILVGLTIGLVALLAVMQVMVTARANQSATSSSADSLVNAMLGLYSIERDAKNAGYGLSSVRASLGCEVRARHGAGAAFSFILAPAQITDAASGAPDSLQLMASARGGVLLPTRITSDSASGDASFLVDSDLGVQSGDLMIAVPQELSAGTWCSMFQVVGTSGALNQVPRASDASGWNGDASSSVFPNSGYAKGDYLINLGSFVRNTWSINKGMLRLTRFDVANNGNPAVDLYNNVVQLQAVYGKDTSQPPDNVVDEWNAKAPTSSAEWQQIRAIRMALVARASNREPAIVTLDGAATATTCDSATPYPAAVCWRPDPTGHGVKIDVNPGNTAPDWQHYRYRVLETTIALRNTIWQQ